MKLTKLHLAKWQELIDEFKTTDECAMPSRMGPFSPVAFRVDGTQFSVGIFYGAFTYNDVMYTVIEAAEEGAYIAIHPKFREWLIKRKEPKKKPAPKGKQLTLDIGGTDK